MAYTKQTWQDLPSKTTPINASRLGHIEQGIYDAASTADTAASDASSAISGLADKVDKVEGKGLSTNDFTDTLKTKLDNIETGAEVNVQSDWNQSDNSADDYIKNKPTLGTASSKNSTSVVTDSTDLVESGAVLDTLRDAEVVEGKNLLPNDATTQTLNGVSFTVNRDGSITANGTATANAQLIMYLPSTLSGDYLFSSGLQPIGSDTTYDASVWDYTSNARTKKWDGTTNSNLSFDSSFQEVKIVTGHSTAFIFRVKSGKTVNNVVLKPMICHATETDTTYEPYYTPLKDVVPTKADNSVIGTVEGANASKAWSVGEHFISGGQFKEVTQPIASGGAINDSNTVDKPIADIVTIKKISVTPSTGITFNTANAIKIFDKLIMINIVIDSISLSTGSATQIGYVETSARPSKEIYTTGVSNNSTPIRIAINTNGSIFVAPQTAITSGKVGFSLIYEI